MTSEQRFTRFKDAGWFGINKKILIGGCGGTGSWLAILLSRMANHQLFIVDFDNYDATNLAGQFVTMLDVGSPKVVALSSHLLNFSGLKVTAINDKYTSESVAFDIMFACFDNMSARKTMFLRWKENLQTHDNKEQCLFVDLRLVAESFVIIFVQGNKPKQVEYYEANLFTDDEVEPLACTLKQTTHSAAMCGAMTVALFSSWIANQVDSVEICNVPYQSEFFIPNFLLTTLNI